MIPLDGRRDTLAEQSEAGVLQPEVDEIVDGRDITLVLYNFILTLCTVITVGDNRIRNSNQKKRVNSKIKTSKMSHFARASIHKAVIS